MVRLFGKKNKVAPLNVVPADPKPVDDKPPVQKQNYVRKLTPYSSENSSSSASSKTDDETFYLVTDSKTSSGNDLLNLLTNGVPANKLHPDLVSAFLAGKISHADKKFAVHEFMVPGDEYEINEKGNSGEVIKFDALNHWVGAQSFSPNVAIDKGKSINSKEISFTVYVAIPGDTQLLMNSARGGKGKFPDVHFSADQAFYEAKKTFPKHALTVMELKIPLAEKNNINSESDNLIGYLKARATSILSFTQLQSDFRQGKVFAESSKASPSPKK